MILLLEFAVLQVFDLVSTLTFLRHGVAEANPLMRMALAVSVPGVVALGVPKVFAVALAAYAWRSGGTRLLRRVNFIFGACVVWNLVALATV